MVVWSWGEVRVEICEGMRWNEVRMERSEGGDGMKLGWGDVRG